MDSENINSQFQLLQNRENYDASNSFINRARIILRRCSFCHCNGHNITMCNDPKLEQSRQLFLNKKEQLLNNSIRITTAITDMEVYLYSLCMEQSMKDLVKAVTVRFCGIRIQSNLRTIINTLLCYIFQTNIINITYTQFIRNVIINDHINDNFILFNPSDISILIVKTEEIDSLDKTDCSICYGCVTTQTKAKLNCQHCFCSNCIIDWISRIKLTCPMCRTEIKKIECYDNESFNILHRNNQ
jgi:hypothetical protein